MQRIVCWFRRDLRVEDQAALYHATRDAESVIPLFVIDPTLMAAPHAGGPRVAFLRESLQQLDSALRALGSHLILREGDPVEVVPRMAHDAQASAVYVNRDYGAYGQARDELIARALAGEGVVFRSFKDLLMVEPEELLTGQGRPYSVFTPYGKQWTKLAVAAPLPTLHRPLNTPRLHTLRLPSLAHLGWQDAGSAQTGGLVEGQRLLAQFTTGDEAPILSYAVDRNRPALQGTSRLSPHLRFGTISVRTAMAAARTAAEQHPEQIKGPQVWQSELAWREFYMAWLYHFPYVTERAFNERYHDLAWRDDPEQFQSWCAGMTGYPIVDAGMRQLNQEGWMHNRLRMIVASFLTKDLLLDWRLGERYFWQQLTCAERASNVGGWQWSASTGTDAQPYFRIFNPVSQGQTHDPQGEYVRRYVPELAALPDKYLHAPWTLPATEAARLAYKPGKTYPHPLVDHDEQRRLALALFKKSS